MQVLFLENTSGTADSHRKYVYFLVVGEAKLFSKVAVPFFNLIVMHAASFLQLINSIWCGPFSGLQLFN